MQKTWGTFKYEIARIVNDPQAAKFSDDMLASVNDALRILASTHTGVASTFNLVGDGATASFPVPDNAVDSNDGIRIRGVYDVTVGVWMTESDIIPGMVPDEGYMIWPDYTLKFNPIPPTTRVYNVHYIAYYNDVDDDNSIIDIPKWAYEAVKLYAAGRVLQSPVSQLTLLANFRTRVDSGNPEHNPMLDLSKYYITQFWDILAAHPAPQLDKIS